MCKNSNNIEETGEYKTVPKILHSQSFQQEIPSLEKFKLRRIVVGACAQPGHSAKATRHALHI